VDSSAPGGNGRILVASDWHLGTRSPRAHAQLALAFLRRALADGDQVVLNGDIFEGLFERERAARLAHPEVVSALSELSRQGRLRQTQGNHDPQSGEERVELEWPGVGRILIAHGHAVDPLHGSAIGKLGDGISRHLGSLALVRGAARLANWTAETIAGERMVQIFRDRCLAAVDRGGYALGIFGHVHRQHLQAGERYANAGWLTEDRLEYLLLNGDGVHARALDRQEVG
jgi:UDP-2,3-diacylglucosamine pyrophosphatase LpxH